MDQLLKFVPEWDKNSNFLIPEKVDRERGRVREFEAFVLAFLIAWLLGRFHNQKSTP